MKSAADEIYYRRHPRARSYLLRLNADGQILVTIPPRGSIREAQRFVERNTDWIKRQKELQRLLPGPGLSWRPGTEILFRGRPVILEMQKDCGRPVVVFGSQRIFVSDARMNLRRPIEEHLRQLAAAELPVRTWQLAETHGINIVSVTVRNQSSRWGSCSTSGGISLNWRLIQSPAFVRDYIILHELMHRKEMNHSRRFWRLVEKVCPSYERAERWLSENVHRVGL